MGWSFLMTDLFYAGTVLLGLGLYLLTAVVAEQLQQPARDPHAAVPDERPQHWVHDVEFLAAGTHSAVTVVECFSGGRRHGVRGDEIAFLVSGGGIDSDSETVNSHGGNTALR